MGSSSVVHQLHTPLLPRSENMTGLHGTMQTHTAMEQLVLRSSAKGSQGLRHSFYANDGSNNPPMSPTAKFKGDVYAHEDPPKDPNRFPYLPHPYPLNRRGRAHGGNPGHPGGFKSLQEPRQPPKFPDEEQIYSTYSEWWQAQRPPDALPHDKDATFSTSFWPYGRRISCVASMDDSEQFYNLDKRIMKNHAYYKNRRDPLSSTSGMSRSRSELLGSQAEHFGYSRSLGQTVSSDSHAGASFHATRKGLLASGSAAGSNNLSGTRNVWDSMRAQASAPQLPTAAGQRAGSAPSTSRSVDAQAGRSQYEPRASLRNLGLATRTHAEWCLPQPPPHPNPSS